MFSPASINWYPTLAVIPGTTRPAKAIPQGKLPAWPYMIMATFGVALGIFLLEQWDARAGWLLAILILLSMMFAYRQTFNSQLQLLFGSKSISTATPGPITAPGNTSRITNPGLYPPR